MFIKIEDKEIKKEIEKLVRESIKKILNYPYVKNIVEDEIRKKVRVEVKT